MSSTLVSRVVGIGLIGIVALSGAATAWAGPVTTKVVISRKTLKPGLTLVHSRIRVRGVSGAQEVYKIAWKVGNPHVRLHSSLLGPYDGRWITDSHISHLATSGGPVGLVAAMTGDYSAYDYSSPVERSMTSGLLVQDRRAFRFRTSSGAYRFGTGGLAVGYKPNGRFIFGHPTLRPMKLDFPGSTFATVGAFNPTGALAGLIRSDQVAVYTNAREVITIPAGAIGVALSSNELATEVRGRQDGYTNTTGVSRPETVTAFRITDPAPPAVRRTASMPIAAPGTCAANVCQPGESVTVPDGGVVLLARTDTANQVAAAGLEAQAASGTPKIDTEIDDAGWDNVSDVTGGKPMLVSAGRAISRQPASVDDWQWTCGGGCWRPALVSSGGYAWMIMIGGKGGTGLTMRKFADVLADMGATDAMGFDNNNSAELWRPGHTPITGYGYERMLPTATSLAYRG